MASIKNLEKLSGILEAEDLEKLDAAAENLKKQSNIDFNIIGLEDDVLEVEATQGKVASGNYANHKTLTRRTSELFGKYLKSGLELKVDPVEYAESPATVVTPQWLSRKMQEKDVRIKQIAFDTGIDRTDISGWIKGTRPMSQIVKAMFYFYFSR